MPFNHHSTTLVIYLDFIILTLYVICLSPGKFLKFLSSLNKQIFFYFTCLRGTLARAADHGYFPCTWGCFPLCQNFWSKWSTSRGGPLWPVGPVRPKIAVPLSEIFASSPTPARQHSQNDGWFRSKCLWVQFKLQKPDITFLLKQSCTQGSVIAVQPNFFFCFWFSSAFKDNTLLASPYVDDVFVLFFS